MGRELLTTPVADAKASPPTGWGWTNSTNCSSADIDTTTPDAMRIVGATGGAYDWWDGTYTAPFFRKLIEWEQDYEMIAMIHCIQASAVDTSIAVLVADPSDGATFVRAEVYRNLAQVCSGASYAASSVLTPADDQAVWVKAWKHGSLFGVSLAPSATRPAASTDYTLRSFNNGSLGQAARRVGGQIGFGFCVLRGAGTGSPLGEISYFEGRIL